MKQKGRKVGQKQNRYAADLIKTTSIRIDDDLRDEAEKVAAHMGLSFSQFVRLSIRRNIEIYKKIELELVQKSSNTIE